MFEFAILTGAIIKAHLPTRDIAGLNAECRIVRSDVDSEYCFDPASKAPLYVRTVNFVDGTTVIIEALEVRTTPTEIRIPSELPFSRELPVEELQLP
jgi:hypothetical protein